MSDNYLRIIPTNPPYVPDWQQQEEAREWLSYIFPKKDISFEISKEIELVDAGENFESITCNLCIGTIMMSDWLQAIHDAKESKLENLAFTCPNCKQVTDLNDLYYKGPMGFSKFRISIANPRFDLGSKDMEDLEEMLGTFLRKIWVRI